MEQSNELIRRFLPEGSNFHELGQREINHNKDLRDKTTGNRKLNHVQPLKYKNKKNAPALMNRGVFPIAYNL